jgi:hypothetical protein
LEIRTNTKSDSEVELAVKRLEQYLGHTMDIRTTARLDHNANACSSGIYWGSFVQNLNAVRAR